MNLSKDDPSNSEASVCRTCGATLLPNESEASCPACLVFQALTPDLGSGEADPPSTGAAEQTWETVVIGEIDSEVPNLLFEDGCTISDLISQCREDAATHGQFVRCVAHLTKDLQAEGFLSGKESAAIQQATARSK